MSLYKEIIQDQLPDIYKSDALEINTLGSTLDNVQNDLNSLEKEVNPLTAEGVGLETWENFFKLPSNPNETIQNRRAKVIAELIKFTSEHNVITVDEMRNIIKFFGDDAEIIEHFSIYVFDVILKSNGSFNLNTDDLIKVIKSIKPSWVDFTLELQSDRGLQIQSDAMAADVIFPICNLFSVGGGLF